MADQPARTLYTALQAVAKKHPRRTAISAGDRAITFSELSASVESLARGLRALSVGPDSKVAIILSNCAEYVHAFFAPAALGATIVPLSPLLRQKEIQHILSEAEVSVVITEPRPMGNAMQTILESARPNLPALRHIVMREPTPGYASLGELPADDAPLDADSVSPDALAALIYTSGTTGVPKAVMHSQRNLTALPSRRHQLQASGWAKVKLLIRLTREYDSRFVKWGFKQRSVLSPAPFHAFLGFASFFALLQGSRLVIAEKFHPARVLELIERERVTALLAAPTMVTALLNSDDLAKRDLSSLLAVAMSAAPVPPELARRARKAFGCPVVISFGATELIGGGIATNLFDPDALQTETVGRVPDGVGVRVVDDQRREVARGEVGELAMRLDRPMLGYYHAPDLTAQSLDADGWYYTGDLASMDAQGYVRIVGRKKDMIIRGGQNIFPAEIEAHLLGKPAIENVGVVGVPDALAGERVWAFVVPAAGHSLAPNDVMNLLRGEIAPYKVPDQVRIVSELPMTPTGKVQKFVLRERALDELRDAKT